MVIMQQHKRKKYEEEYYKYTEDTTKYKNTQGKNGLFRVDIVFRLTLQEFGYTTDDWIQFMKQYDLFPVEHVNRKKKTFYIEYPVCKRFLFVLERYIGLNVEDSKYNVLWSMIRCGEL